MKFAKQWKKDIERNKRITMRNLLCLCEELHQWHQGMADQSEKKVSHEISFNFFSSSSSSTPTDFDLFVFYVFYDSFALFISSLSYIIKRCEHVNKEKRRSKMKRKNVATEKRIELYRYQSCSHIIKQKIFSLLFFVFVLVSSPVLLLKSKYTKQFH